MTVAEAISVLQTSIGPAVLISGVGYLIMALTNRLARVIDRGRFFANEQFEGREAKHRHMAEQLRILSHRARLLQRSIFFAVTCALFAVLLIVTLFLLRGFKIEAAWFIGVLFFGALGSLAVCLVAFLQELKSSLVAFQMEIGE